MKAQIEIAVEHVQRSRRRWCVVTTVKADDGRQTTVRGPEESKMAAQERARYVMQTCMTVLADATPGADLLTGTQRENAE